MAAGLQGRACGDGGAHPPFALRLHRAVVREDLSMARARDGRVSLGAAAGAEAAGVVLVQHLQPAPPQPDNNDQNGHTDQMVIR